MLLEFEKKVADFIKANELFGSAAKVLLAVSGGADSTALLYAMRTLRAEGVFDAELLCAHINHQLRGAEADLDEDFVLAQAAELKLAITTKRLDVRGFAGRNKLSIETAARKLRIAGLLQIARANDCEALAMAHQKKRQCRDRLAASDSGHRLSRAGRYLANADFCRRYSICKAAAVCQEG